MITKHLEFPKVGFFISYATVCVQYSALTAAAFDYSLLGIPVMLRKDDNCLEEKAFFQYKVMAQDDSCFLEMGCLFSLSHDLPENKQGK